jgi:hypothetical protein
VPNDSGSDFPGTYGDGMGCLIDWSGWTGVWVCFQCNEQGGTYLDLDDTRHAAAVHRVQKHAAGNTRYARTSEAMSEENVLKSRHRTCMDCGKPSVKRGLCNSCANARTIAWLRENGKAGPDESITMYRKRQPKIIHTTGRWAKKETA